MIHAGVAKLKLYPNARVQCMHAQSGDVHSVPTSDAE